MAHECEHCGKFFNKLSDFKQHERIHTGEKPYKCRHCEKCFYQSSACRQHERTHTGEKPYKCGHCNKCFGQLGDCKRHERTHTGEKPYKCRHCKKCFSRLSTCKEHEGMHTRDSSFRRNQHDQACFQLKRHHPESSSTEGGEQSGLLFSLLTEENSREFESLTCWICQEEFSSRACLIKHYDDHMII